MARVQPSLMSTGRTSPSGYLLHSPTVPCTEWYLYVDASAFSYTGTAEAVSSSRASTSAPEAATSWAVPDGSGLSALTLWVATVRSPPPPVLSVSSPPKRFSQTAPVSSTAIRALADLRTKARSSSTGMNTPSHGRNVSVRLPRLPIRFGIRACVSITRASSSARAARISPRRQMPRSPRQPSSRRRSRESLRSGPRPSLPVSVIYACAIPSPHKMPCAPSAPRLRP